MSEAHASEAYRALQRDLHSTNAAYGTSGQAYAAVVTQFCANHNLRTVLDYGCGKGTLKQHVKIADVTEYDIAIPGKDDRAVLTEHDFVTCTDVLEHIEIEHLPAVLADLRRCARHLLLVAVHCGPAKKILADGRNAHLIQQPPRWWLELFWDSGFELGSFSAEIRGFLATLRRTSP